MASALRTRRLLLPFPIIPSNIHASSSNKRILKKTASGRTSAKGLCSYDSIRIKISTGVIRNIRHSNSRNTFFIHIPHLSTLPRFHRLCYKQLSKNAQNIRNPFLFCSKIKVSNPKDPKQKSGELLMFNSTTNTYTLKREILTFPNKISNERLTRH